MSKNELPKITVKNSGLIKLFTVEDPLKGVVAVGEVGRQLPFLVRRFYFITGFKDLVKNLERGQHAHKQTKQVIFCLAGHFRLKLDDGENRQEIILSQSSFFGVYLGKRLWHSMTDFSSDCVILVLADKLYDESDYLRNYDQFLAFIGKTKNE